MRNRSALVVICVLVALGSLLCVGKESLAKQPGKAHKAGGQAASHGPTHRPTGAPNAGHRGSAAQPRPAHQGSVNRGPSSRPTHHRPAGRVGPPGPSGERAAPHERPAPPTGREPGSRKPGASHTARPQPEQTDGGRSSRTVNQRPVPRATPHHRGEGRSTLQQKGAGSPGEHGKPASPPGRGEGHPTGQGGTGRPEQAGQSPGHDDQAERSTPQREKGATRAGSADRPDSGAPGRRPPTRVESGRSALPEAAEPSYRPAGTTGGTSGSRSMNPLNDGPTAITGSPSAHVAGRPAARSTHTTRGRDAVPAAPPGGEQRPAGAQAHLAPGTPFASTKLLLDPPWDKGSSLVERDAEAVRSVAGGPRDLSTARPHKGSLTQRGPPLRLPLPGQVMGGAAATGSGSSGDGTAPLFAVIAPCLIAMLCLGRFLVLLAFLRPGTVPRLALERPG